MYEYSMIKAKKLFHYMYKYWQLVRDGTKKKKRNNAASLFFLNLLYLFMHCGAQLIKSIIAFVCVWPYSRLIIYYKTRLRGAVVFVFIGIAATAATFQFGGL